MDYRQRKRLGNIYGGVTPTQEGEELKSLFFCISVLYGTYRSN